MAIVLIRQDGKLELWKKAFLQKYPKLKVYQYLEPHPKHEITMAVVWKHPVGSLMNYPNLACIASFGAGVDFILDDPTLPKGVPITRVVDPMLASDMAEYVVSTIFSRLKNFRQYHHDQNSRAWKPKPYDRIQDHTIGIMGLGTLGIALAKDLIRIGFKTTGWANSAKPASSIPVFIGEKQKTEFLNQTTILVCLLPLTEATFGILNKDTLSQLPRGAYLINVARGGHLIDDDLIELINEGHLSGACLDVFHMEPLPKEHPFWKHPKIQITPHVASVSDPASVVPQLVENYDRLQEGEALCNVIDLLKGY